MRIGRNPMISRLTLAPAGSSDIVLFDVTMQMKRGGVTSIITAAGTIQVDDDPRLSEIEHRIFQVISAAGMEQKKTD